MREIVRERVRVREKRERKRVCVRRRRKREGGTNTWFLHSLEHQLHKWNVQLRVENPLFVTLHFQTK